jgi:uncharacterized protein
VGEKIAVVLRDFSTVAGCAPRQEKTMYLDLTDILRASGTAVEKKIELTQQSLDDFEVTEPIRGWVRATNARRSIVVTGRAATSVRLQCARCLRSFELPLELDLEAVSPVSFFMARLDGSVESEEHEPDNELSDDELAALFDAHTLDVLELIRQAIVLQAPIAPRCSDDCPGLPEAVNYKEEHDSRWDALSKWQRSEDASAQNN